MYLVIHTVGNTSHIYRLPLQVELTKSIAYNSLVLLTRERRKGKIHRKEERWAVIAVWGVRWEGHEDGNGGLSTSKSLIVNVTVVLKVLL